MAQKTTKEFIDWVRECFSNGSETFEGVLSNSTTEMLGLHKSLMPEIFFKETGVQSGRCDRLHVYSVTTAFPIQQRNISRHVYSDSKLTTWHKAAISSELYEESSTTLQVPSSLCKSVRKMNNYAFWELLVKPVVMVRGEVPSTWPSEPTHISRHSSSHRGDRYCSPYYGRQLTMKKCMSRWCGRVDDETRRGKSPYQLFVKYKLPNLWRAR
jgi:hypothetical protein